MVLQKGVTLSDVKLEPVSAEKAKRWRDGGLGQVMEL